MIARLLKSGSVLRRTDLLASLALVGLGGFLWWQARSLPPVRFFVDSIGPGGLPSAIGIGLMLGGSTLAARAVVDLPALRSSRDPREEPVADERRWRDGVGIIASIGFVLVLPALGYLLATTLLLIALMLAAGGRRHWRRALAVSVVLTPALYLLYAIMLRVDLTPGPALP